MTKDGKDNSKQQERRKHARLSIINGVLQPIDLSFEDETGRLVIQPAILDNLSAGGIRLLTFLEPPKTTNIDLVLNLPGVGEIPVKGKIAWMRTKGEVFLIGIEFLDISDKAKKRINSMAEDYEDCNTRIMLKLPDVCTHTCTANGLCNKAQKDSSKFTDAAN